MLRVKDKEYQDKLSEAESVRVLCFYYCEES